MEIYGIECSSRSNCDLEGRWFKAEMQKTCEELGIPKEEWISYILDHVFIDCEGWTSELADFFIKNDCILAMDLKLGDDYVTLRKLS